jgi:hypothetical protein
LYSARNAASSLVTSSFRPSLCKRRISLIHSSGVRGANPSRARTPGSPSPATPEHVRLLRSESPVLQRPRWRPRVRKRACSATGGLAAMGTRRAHWRRLWLLWNRREGSARSFFADASARRSPISTSPARHRVACCRHLAAGTLRRRWLNLIGRHERRSGCRCAICLRGTLFVRSIGGGVAATAVVLPVAGVGRRCGRRRRGLLLERVEPRCIVGDDDRRDLLRGRELNDPDCEHGDHSGGGERPRSHVPCARRPGADRAPCGSANRIIERSRRPFATRTAPRCIELVVDFTHR